MTLTKKILTGLAVLIISMTAFAGTEIIAEFPVKTFLENIVVDRENNLFFTSYLDGKVYKATAQGESELFARIDGNISGIALYKRGSLIVSGSNSEGKGCIFQLNSRGEVTKRVVVEGASFFLNGIIPQERDRFLVADSDKGVIWQYNARTGKAKLWLDHELLKSPLAPGEGLRIGVNGLKIHEKTLYATNTQQQRIIKIPLERGGRAGTPEIFVENFLGDDFAVDREGNLYVATHPFNSLVKIDVDGELETLAGAAEGMIGSTAAAFGKGEYSDRLFVVTNGGMSLPPEGGVREALLVLLKIED